MELEFLVVTNEVSIEIEETVEPYARALITVMELDKTSRNNRFYTIEEGESIVEKLKGKPVYYGTDSLGRHDNPLKNPKSKNEPIGIIESARIIGNKIKAVIKITKKSLIDKIRNGVKFWFSIGGNAISEAVRKVKGKLVHFLKGINPNHIQMVDVGTPIGFKNAKLDKVLEVNETVLFCKSGKCEVVREKEEDLEVEIEGSDNYEFEI